MAIVWRELQSPSSPASWDLRPSQYIFGDNLAFNKFNQPTNQPAKSDQPCDVTGVLHHADTTLVNRARPLHVHERHVLASQGIPPVPSRRPLHVQVHALKARHVQAAEDGQEAAEALRALEETPLAALHPDVVGDARDEAVDGRPHHERRPPPVEQPASQLREWRVRVEDVARVERVRLVDVDAPRAFVIVVHLLVVRVDRNAL